MDQQFTNSSPGPAEPPGPRRAGTPPPPARRGEPPTPRRRGRPADAGRRQRVLGAVVDHLVDADIGPTAATDRFTLRDTAEAAGTTTRMLVHDFGSRVGLLEAVREEAAARVREAPARSWHSEARTVAALALATGAVRDHPSDPRVLLAEAALRGLALARLEGADPELVEAARRLVPTDPRNPDTI